MVSVIIPAYNSAHYLAETVQSVIDQSYTEWELIIINDGSTDDTKEIAAGFTQDTRITVIDQQNAGVSTARNKGYEQGKGNFFAFLDADDVWEKDNLKEKVAYLEEHPEVGLVHSDMAIIDGQSEKTTSVYQGKEGDLLKSLLLWDGTNIPAPSSILVKKEVIEKVGVFDTAFSTAADQDFFFRVAKEYKIGRIPKALGRYRIHGNNMHQNIKKMEEDHIGVYQKAKKIRLFPSYWFQRKCFSNLYLILAGSWWVDGNNKWRGLQFMVKSVIAYPPSFFKLVRKLAS